MCHSFLVSMVERNGGEAPGSCSWTQTRRLRESSCIARVRSRHLTSTSIFTAKARHVAAPLSLGVCAGISIRNVRCEVIWSADFHSEKRSWTVQWLLAGSVNV
jgi:hypothetical protein